MKSVLRSIKPYWFFLVCEGKKTIEVGKDYPKAADWDRTVELYCSKDMKSFNRIPKEYQEKYRKYLGKVGARFICDKVDMSLVGYIGHEPCYWDILDGSWLTKDEIMNYGKWKPLYGWRISDLKIYDKPKELSELYRPCPDKYQYCEWCKYGSIVLSPDEEEYALYYGGNYDTYETVCHNIVTCPPQSWCYVKEEYYDG